MKCTKLKSKNKFVVADGVHKYRFQFNRGFHSFNGLIEAFRLNGAKAQVFIDDLNDCRILDIETKDPLEKDCLNWCATLIDYKPPAVKLSLLKRLVG